MADTVSNQASTPSGINRALPISGAAVALSTAIWAYLAYSAPLDAVQGVIQKILYVHVPCWFAAYAGFAVTAVCSALYLWKNDERFDRVAVAGAQIGVLFCTLGLVTGPIWAKGTWGHWWAWDPRLTVTLLLWFVYLAYLLLRSFTEGSTRTARFASVYGIAGLTISSAEASGPGWAGRLRWGLSRPCSPCSIWSCCGSTWRAGGSRRAPMRRNGTATRASSGTRAPRAVPVRSGLTSHGRRDYKHLSDKSASASTVFHIGGNPLTQPPKGKRVHPGPFSLGGDKSCAPSDRIGILTEARFPKWTPRPDGRRF